MTDQPPFSFEVFSWFLIAILFLTYFVLIPVIMRKWEETINDLRASIASDKAATAMWGKWMRAFWELDAVVRPSPEFDFERFMKHAERVNEIVKGVDGQ